MSESEDDGFFRTTSDHMSCDWRISIKEVLARYFLESADFGLTGEEFSLVLYDWDVYAEYNKRIKQFSLKRKTTKCALRILYSVSIKLGNKVVKNVSKDFNFEINLEYKNFLEIPINEFTDYMKRGTEDAFVIFECDLRSQDNVCAKETQTQLFMKEFENLSKSLESVFLEEDLSDVKIKIGKKEFKAHKIILAARSPVFYSMFKHNMSEKLSSTIEIEDCDSESFENFLKFLYTGNLNLVTSSNAVNIYRIAHKYELKDLQIECRNRMSNSVSVDNICDVLDLCVTYGENELLKTATDFFIHNFKGVLKTERWPLFLQEKFTLANELLEKLADTFSA